MFTFKNYENIQKAEHLKNDEFLNGLITGEYLIVYHFDKEKECIVYEAILTDEVNYNEFTNRDSDHPLYVNIEVDANGTINKDDEYSDGNVGLSVRYTLLYFISKNDLNYDFFADYLEKYKGIADFLKQFEGLSVKDIKRRKEERKDFLDLVNSLSSFALNDDNRLAHLYPMLAISEYNCYLHLKIGFPNGRSYNINSLNSFIDAVLDKKEVRYGKECAFIHDISHFDKSSQKIIEILHGQNPYYLQSEEISFDRSKDIFESYLGEDIELSINKEDRYRVFYEKYHIDDEIINASVSVGSDGKLSPIPHIESGNEVLIYSNKNVLLNRKNKTVQIITFNDEVNKKIYQYLVEHPDLNYEYIKDIFVDKLIPLTQNKINVDKDYQEAHKAEVFKVNYFADLTDDNKLILKTSFSKGKEDITKEAIEDNIIYKRIYSSFLALINSLNLVEEGIIDDEDIVLAFLTTSIPLLDKVADVYVSDRIKSLSIKTLGKINIKSSFDMDWLDVSISSDEYSKEEIDAILSAYRKRRKFVKIKDNIITLNDESVASFADFVEDFNLEDKDNTKVPLHEIFKLSSYNDNLEVNYDNKIKQIINDIKNYENSDYKVGEQFKNVLRPYQISAFKWLQTLKKYHLSGILADDMGLGKTLEMISFISSFEENSPILIVAPKNVLYNWENEFHTWDKLAKVIVIAGDKLTRINAIKNINIDKKIVYLTSYDSLRMDIEEYKNIEFSLMILDEAQYIKNVSALKTRAVKEIKSTYRYALTGTPIENSLFDLWSIFDFLMPNYLYGYNYFKDEYQTNIMNDDENAKKRLKAKIRPFILRRVKGDVLKELPSKTESIFTCDMVASQRELYKAELIRTKQSLAIDASNKISVLAQLTKLRELCIDPQMVYENFEELSGKLLSAIDLIKEAIAGRHKILLFSAFTKSLDHIKNLLDEEEINSYYISGKTSAKERVTIANNFNKQDDVKIVLISLKAGGVGINLVGADIVIHLDPWWNLSAENQATDRAHRIGQKNPVTVFKMVTKDSIEEKVIKLQEKKAELVNAVISTKDGSVSGLTNEDIKYLLS